MAPALETLGLRTPLVAFVAQDPGQTALLVARGLVLFAALVAARRRGTAGARALAIAGTLFMLSLAAQGLFVVDLVATAAIALVLARGTTRRAGALVAVLVALALILPVLPVRAPPSTHVPSTAPEATLYWRSRGNLYRAHAAAFGWAIGEATPAEGYLTLARIDWELGDHDRARRVLSKVLAKATSDDVLAKARELDSRWGP